MDTAPKREALVMQDAACGVPHVWAEPYIGYPRADHVIQIAWLNPYYGAVLVHETITLN